MKHCCSDVLVAVLAADMRQVIESNQSCTISGKGIRDDEIVEGRIKGTTRLWPQSLLSR